MEASMELFFGGLSTGMLIGVVLEWLINGRRKKK